MKVYYLLFFITLSLSILLDANSEKQWRWKLFFVFLPLFVYGAIRVDYGNDYSAYEELFNYIHSDQSFQLDSSLHAEVGYQFLNVIMPSFRCILVLNAFLLSLALGVFCYQVVPRRYLWLFIILLFLNPEKNIFGQLVALRNGLVVTSFLLCFPLLYKRRIIPFAVLTVILGSIHTSALLFLPIAYFAGSSHPFTKKDMWFWGGIIVLLLFLSMSRLSQVLALFVERDLFSRYEAYTDAVLRRGVLISIVNIASIFLIITYFIQRGKSLEQKENSLLRLGILFSVMFLFGSLSTRSSYYYDVFYLGAVVKVFSDKHAPIISRIGFLALVIVTSCYSMFHVWMGSEWWNHSVYHSLLGSW